jgi:hypothetical protein
VPKLRSVAQIERKKTPVFFFFSTFGLKINKKKLEKKFLEPKSCRQITLASNSH